MRRVLIVAYDFPPRGATGVFRVAKFVRYLPAFGWQPVVLTASAQGWVQDEGLLAELPPNLEVLWVAQPFGQGGAPSPFPTPSGVARSWRSALRRRLRRWLLPDPQIVWVPFAVRAATARLRQGDIAAMLTTSPPHSVQLVGLWLKRRFPELPWVMDLRDIWSDSPTIGDPLTYKCQRVLEHACLRRADRVVAVTDALKTLLQRQYAVAPGKLTTITNGFDPADFAVPAPQPADGALRVTYVGTMVGTRAPAAQGFGAALRQLVAQGVTADSLQVRLVGSFDPQVHAWADPLVRTGVVTLVPFVSHAAAVAEMAAADVCLLIMTDDWEGKIAVPNKLYEYFATGKPVLALAPGGEIGRLVELYGAGKVVGPFAVGEIVAALQQLIEQHRQGLLQPLLPDDQRLARFHRQELARQLATVFDALVH